MDDDDFGSGIPITWTSISALVTLSSLCCAAVLAYVSFSSGDDPEWTSMHSLVGLGCAALAALLAMGSGAFALYRILRRRF